jgi:integrase
VLQKMLQKYLLLRGSTYYFRWTVPPDLRLFFGCREVIKSLRTHELSVATARSSGFLPVVESLIHARSAYACDEICFNEFSIYLEVYKRKMASRNSTFGLITIGNVSVDYDGDEEKELAQVKRLNELGIITAQEKTGDEEGDVSGKKLSELFSDFIEFKTSSITNENESISDSVKKSHIRHYGILIAILGDLPIRKLSSEMVKDAILSCRFLPKGNLTKAYKNIPVAELIEMEIPEEHHLSDKSVKEILKTLQGMFSYAVEKKLILSSPARDLKLKLVASKTYASFTNAEINQLFLTVTAEDDWKMWVPLIAMYSGARRSEIVQLRKQDVRYDSDSKRDYMLITDQAGSVKTKNSIRQVPIHKDLISMGFLDFVEKSDERLFPNLKSDAVTQWFTNVREKLGIDRVDDFGNKKVFHSYRHSFITCSRGAGNPIDHVQQVVGHEKISVGITDRYSHRQPLKVLLDVVDKVTYE